MRLSDDELEARLQQWGAEYCGSGIVGRGIAECSTGPSTISTIVEHHGFSPDAQIAKMCVHLDSEADQVEAIVLELRRQGIDGACDSECLRARYLRWQPNEDQQLRHLRWAARQYGLSPLFHVSMGEYLRRLEAARCYVGGALSKRRRIAA